MGLPFAVYRATVDRTFDLDTATDRIAYAIDASGKTLESIAAEIGCTHATLSQWQRGRTDPNSIKAGLLQAFGESTGFDVRWLLTGRGPRVSRYLLTSEMDRRAHGRSRRRHTAAD